MRVRLPYHVAFSAQRRFSSNSEPEICLKLAWVREQIRNGTLTEAVIHNLLRTTAGPSAQSVVMASFLEGRFQRPQLVEMVKSLGPHDAVAAVEWLKSSSSRAELVDDELISQVSSAAFLHVGEAAARLSSFIADPKLRTALAIKLIARGSESAAEWVLWSPRSTQVPVRALVKGGFWWNALTHAGRSSLSPAEQAECYAALGFSQDAVRCDPLSTRRLQRHQLYRAALDNVERDPCEVGQLVRESLDRHLIHGPIHTWAAVLRQLGTQSTQRSGPKVAVEFLCACGFWEKAAHLWSTALTSPDAQNDVALIMAQSGAPFHVVRAAVVRHTRDMGQRAVILRNSKAAMDAAASARQGETRAESWSQGETRPDVHVTNVLRRISTSSWLSELQQLAATREWLRLGQSQSAARLAFSLALHDLGKSNAAIEVGTHGRDENLHTTCLWLLSQPMPRASSEVCRAFLASLVGHESWRRSLNLLNSVPLDTVAGVRALTFRATRSSCAFFATIGLQCKFHRRRSKSRRNSTILFEITKTTKHVESSRVAERDPLKVVPSYDGSQRLVGVGAIERGLARASLLGASATALRCFDEAHRQGISLPMNTVVDALCAFHEPQVVSQLVKAAQLLPGDSTPAILAAGRRIVSNLDQNWSGNWVDALATVRLIGSLGLRRLPSDAVKRVVVEPNFERIRKVFVAIQDAAIHGGVFVTPDVVDALIEAADALGMIRSASFVGEARGMVEARAFSENHQSVHSTFEYRTLLRLVDGRASWRAAISAIAKLQRPVHHGLLSKAVARISRDSPSAALQAIRNLAGESTIGGHAMHYIRLDDYVLLVVAVRLAHEKQCREASEVLKLARRRSDSVPQYQAWYAIVEAVVANKMQGPSAAWAGLVASGQLMTVNRIAASQRARLRDRRRRIPFRKWTTGSMRLVLRYAKVHATELDDVTGFLAALHRSVGL